MAQTTLRSFEELRRMRDSTPTAGGQTLPQMPPPAERRGTVSPTPEPEPAPPPRRISRASRAQVFAMGRLFDAHLTPLPSGGCRWGDEWSDERAAAEVGCSVNAVKYARLEVFGDLVQEPAPDPLDGLAQRMDQLAADLAAERERSQQAETVMAERIARLEAQLSAERARR